MRSLLFFFSILFSVYIQAETNDFDITDVQSENVISEYVLGAGDVLKIQVYGSPDLDSELRVTEKGTINFPLLGELSVAGMSPNEAEEKIIQGLGEGKFVKNPHVNLVVMQYLSQFVSVLGDVYKPGRFPLDRAMTLTDVLALAGGVTPNGSDIVTLKTFKQGKSIKESYDLREILSRNDEGRDPRIYSGDIVYVAKAPVFYIYGEVQRPGSYRLEREMTVAQALSIGGGLTPKGTDRGIKIKRTDHDGNLINIDAKLDDKLQENDVVVFSESWF